MVGIWLASILLQQTSSPALTDGPLDAGLEALGVRGETRNILLHNMGIFILTNKRLIK